MAWQPPWTLTAKSRWRRAAYCLDRGSQLGGCEPHTPCYHIPMRHSLCVRLQPRGIAPRRLAAAKRALTKERQKRPLFADQIEEEQGSPEERIDRIDQSMIDYDQGHRDLAAKHWRQGRRMLKEVTEETRADLIERWNASSIPSTAAYFADFVRCKLREITSPHD